MDAPWRLPLSLGIPEGGGGGVWFALLGLVGVVALAELLHDLIHDVPTPRAIG